MPSQALIFKALQALVCAFFVAGPLLAGDARSRAQERFRKGVELSHKSESLVPAAEELRKARNLDPDNPEISLALGLVASRLGLVEEARESLEKALTLNPGSVAAHYALALVYEKLERWEKAVSMWSSFMSLSDNPELVEKARKHLEACRSQGAAAP